MEKKDERNSIIVIAPHPDDEVLGCGGTIYKHAQKGDRIHLCVLTDGSKFLDGYRRKEECLKVSQILGINEVIFLDFPDGQLENHTQRLKSALEGLIKGFQKVYTPHPLDHHPDHITSSLAVLSIFEEDPSFELRMYGVYNTFRYNLLVDVTDVYDIKKNALLEYSYSLSLTGVELMIQRTEAFMKYPTINTSENKLYETFFVADKPMTTNEVLSYLTYDLMCQDPHNQLLKKIRATEILMEKLDKEHTLRVALEREVADYKEKMERLRTCEEELNKLKTSVFFRMYHAYHTLKPKIIPPGSLREGIYKRLISFIKRY